MNESEDRTALQFLEIPELLRKSSPPVTLLRPVLVTSSAHQDLQAFSWTPGRGHEMLGEIGETVCTVQVGNCFMPTTCIQSASMNFNDLLD